MTTWNNGWVKTVMLSSTSTLQQPVIDASIFISLLSYKQGFAAGLFAFYRDPQGEPLTERSPSTDKPDFNEE